MRLRATLLRPSGGLRPLASIIKGLFANNEQGVWYDPSDLSTLFQDAAGTIPVTAVEQPVGLMLDKSRGLVLGPELVTNGTFETATGWKLRQQRADTPPLSGAGISGGVLNMLAANGQNYVAHTNGPDLVVGKTYVAVFDIVASTASAGVQIGTFNPTTSGWANNSSYIQSIGRKQVIFQCAYAGRFAFWRFASHEGDVAIDNVSVRELPGNHASQTTATSRPVLSAMVNLLTKTEDFADAAWAWAATGSLITSNVILAPNGTMTADKLVEDTSTGNHRVIQAFALQDNVALTGVFHVKAAERSKVAIQFRNKAGAITSTNCDLIAKTATGGAEIVEIGGGWFRIKLSFSSGSGASTPYMAVLLTAPSGSTNYQGDGASGAYVWGADLRPANSGSNLPDYQRVNTATDYDTAGFPRIERFDAVDDVQNITFPVSLGSNCTVARVAQGGAVTILTGQTIGTSYQINQSHAGLIVVNRALTQSETNAVTRYFQNKGSGK